MSTVLTRIQELAIEEGITIGALERNIGASKGVLSRAIMKGTDIQSKWIQIIVENYPRYSADWLITGRGEMINQRQDLKAVSLLSDKIDASKPIPLVHQFAIAGFGNGDFSISEQDVKEYYIVPKFKYCHVDFMIEVSGSSMYPKYNSGDVIACTILRESKFIQWNKCHVIATKEQGILVKRIKKANDDQHILAISDNKDYDPFVVPVYEITGIALVVGVIRLE